MENDKTLTGKDIQLVVNGIIADSNVMSIKEQRTYIMLVELAEISSGNLSASQEAQLNSLSRKKLNLIREQLKLKKARRSKI